MNLLLINVFIAHARFGMGKAGGHSRGRQCPSECIFEQICGCGTGKGTWMNGKWKVGQNGKDRQTIRMDGW